MARFVAISDVPGITEERFKETLGEVRNWRFDRRAWIVKAYCNLDRGKIIAECEAQEQGQFEDWLKRTGWTVSGIYRVDLIHEAAAIWTV